MILTGENKALAEKICPSSAFLPKNSVRTDLGWKAGIRGEIPVTESCSRRSRWPHGLGLGSLAGIVGSNPTGGHGSPSLVKVVCCQVEDSATDRSLLQRSSTVCVCVCLTVCDLQNSTVRRPWPEWDCCDTVKRKKL